MDRIGTVVMMRDDASQKRATDSLELDISSFLDPVSILSH